MVEDFVSEEQDFKLDVVSGQGASGDTAGWE